VWVALYKYYLQLLSQIKSEFLEPDTQGKCTLFKKFIDPIELFQAFYWL